MNTPGTPVRVLLADDSDIMRDALKKLFEDEPLIEIVGEAPNFSTTVQLIGALQPDVLLLDLHMPQKRELAATTVRSQISPVKCVLAISFANDEDAKALAASYGAVALLDKMTLYTELVPAIMRLKESAEQTDASLNIDHAPDTGGLAMGASE
jgi:DNA-binding NarL/FixJ family response regulator